MRREFRCKCGQAVNIRGKSTHMLAHVKRGDAEIDSSQMRFGDRYEFSWLTQNPKPILRGAETEER